MALPASLMDNLLLCPGNKGKQDYMKIDTVIRLRSTQPLMHFLLRTSFCLLLLVVFAACDNAPAAPTKKPSQAPSTSASGPSYQCTTHTSNPVTLTMYYGSEKQEWIDNVVPDFNSRHITACDGPITVKAIAIGSGESM